VSARRSLSGFVRRYARWGVMQRKCAGLPAYFGLLVLNPLPLATLALLLHPSLAALLACGALAGARMGLDWTAARLLHGRGFPLRALLLSPLRDLLATVAWIQALTSPSIEWRSNRLRVLRGSALRAQPPRRRRTPAGSGTAPGSAAA
jgi:ceramide glucosyltransferase